MRTNDVYFEVGDKIMRVEPKRVSGNFPYEGHSPKMGVVYCVECFWVGPQFNVCMPVGFGGFRRDERGNPVGWRATYFRKVEEIRLCINAVESIKQSVPAALSQVPPTAKGEEQT